MQLTQIVTGSFDPAPAIRVLALEILTLQDLVKDLQDQITALQPKTPEPAAHAGRPTAKPKPKES